VLKFVILAPRKLDIIIPLAASSLPVTATISTPLATTAAPASTTIATASRTITATFTRQARNLYGNASSVDIR
jgi:hypothetical protein